MNGERILTVSEFNQIVSTTLTESFPYIQIEGEVSGLKVRQGRWISFDLKDSESLLPCFGVVGQIAPELLADGAVVRITGSPRLYVPYGKYSFSVRSVEPVGEGALRKAFELMKQKLEAEGLFAPERKRALPLVPTSIGLITSRDGAVIHDMQRTLASRWGKLRLVLAPVAVQGRDAATSVTNALRYFNSNNPVDVIIIARGGGSYEDLAAFNDEGLARAIVASRIPTISAIGHESDVTIADLVADRRAPTPTAAAQIVVPERSEFELRLANASATMEQRLRQRLADYHRDLATSVHRFRRFYEIQSFGLERLKTGLATQRAQIHSNLTFQRQLLLNQTNQLVTNTRKSITTTRQQLTVLAGAIHSIDPAHILKQGYALVRHTDGSVVDSIKTVVQGEQLGVQLKDGTLKTWVIEQHEGKA